jgi:hypothetical protein
VKEKKGEATESLNHRDDSGPKSDRLEGDTPGQCGWLSKERAIRKNMKTKERQIRGKDTSRGSELEMYAVESTQGSKRNGDSKSGMRGWRPS